MTLKQNNRFFGKVGLVLTLALATLAISAPASGDELNTDHVPQDAKWLIHVDFEALAESSIAEYLRNDKSQMVKFARKWMEREYGINPRKDMNSVTIFSDSYKPHSGAIVLDAEFNRNKAMAKLQEHGDVDKTEWNGTTMLTVKMTKPSDHAWREGAGNRRYTSGKKKGHRKGYEKSLTVAYLDNDLTVMTPSINRAKSVIRLINGEKPSLSPDSPLIRDMPEGVCAYGSAIDLAKIKRHDQVFPILRQHERIIWYAGESEGKMFEHVRMEAQSSDVASQVADMMEGYVAMIQLWAGDSQPMKQIANDISIQRQDQTVTVDWQSDTQTTIQAIDDICDRMGFADKIKLYMSAKPSKDQSQKR